MDKRYLPHTLMTRIYAVEMYKNNGDIEYTCRKYHISRTSLWRWLNRYDGTSESLKDKSHRPLTKHPNAHTDEEIKHIKDIIRRTPSITLNELWFKLKNKYGYTRHIGSLYNFMRKNNLIFHDFISKTSKPKHNKKYHTPSVAGEKWQIDVKYVPNECKSPKIRGDHRYYQYTCIDEATRQRYLYWYMECTPQNTCDFIKRAIKFYNYTPKEIQTDNGTEFSYNQAKVKKVHPMDELCEKLNIYHHKIRPRTPQHNGKVERSHRSDNERFYTFLKFYSLEDLRKQGSKYLRRSNNIPMSVLGYLTPLEKRKQIECVA